jgi:hypothetical protein
MLKALPRQQINESKKINLDWNSKSLASGIL